MLLNDDGSEGYEDIPGSPWIYFIKLYSEVVSNVFWGHAQWASPTMRNVNKRTPYVTHAHSRD